MCLISAAPKGVKKDKDKLKGFIEQGMSSNTDGSGYAVKKKGILYLEKGFRNPDDLLKSIVDKKLTIDDELIIHHRIGTSGEKNDINMHPFLVTDDTDLLQTTKMLDCKVPIMAHNGVFSSFTDRSSRFSDTFHFIQKAMFIPEFLQLLKRDQELFKNQFKNVIIGQKLAFLFPDHPMILLGNFVEDEGFFHSNGGYKKYVYDSGGSSSFRNQNNRFNSEYRRNIHGFNQNGEIDDEHFDYDNDFVDNPRSNTCSVVPKSEVIKRNDLILSTRAESNIIPFVNKTFDKVISKNLSFFSNEISIRPDNYNHFILIPKESISNSLVVNSGWYIEELQTDAIDGQSVLIPTKGDQRCHWFNVLKNIDKFQIHVKQQYEEFYKGFYNIVRFNNDDPSKSMMKKIEKKLNQTRGRKSLKYKDYGYMYWADLYFYFNKNTKPAVIQSLDELIELENKLFPDESNLIHAE